MIKALPNNNRGAFGGPNRALTLMEMVVALAIMAIVFAAVLPQFLNINNSWASRQGAAEALQNGRVLTDHMYKNLMKSVRITAVSDSAETNGYIEFEAENGSTYRYAIMANNYVGFGLVGSLDDVAGPVGSLRFTCYGLDDLDTPITDIDSIRMVKVDTTLTNSAALGQDKTFTSWAYLRINAGNRVGGLVAWWKLDEATGMTANDSSGNDNHGALTNMFGDEWTDGIIDGALEFDGINNYVEDADGEDYINGLTAFTISVWIQSDLIGTNNGVILGKLPTGDDNVLSLRYDVLGLYGGGTNGIKAGVGVSGIQQQIESSSNVQTTGWQHLAVTWSSGNQLALYIDGSIDSPTYNMAAQTGSTSGATTLFIGRGAKNSADVWDGRIDDVRIYGRVLSAAEIAALASILRYSGSTEARAAFDTTSLTISTPPGAKEDDLLIAAVATDGDTSLSLAPPGGQGWTEIDIDDQSSEVTLGAWWKNVDASEPATHQFTWSGGEQAYGWMMRFIGHDTSDPINVYGRSGQSGSTPTSPAVTTTVGDTIILRLGAFDDNDITRDDPGLAGHTAITMDSSSYSGTGQVLYEEFTEGKRSSNGTGLTINKPSGTSGGDLLIAAVVNDGNSESSLSPPGGEGWTEIDLDDYGNQITLGVWWKLADASESPTHRFTWSGDQEAYGWIMRFTGHDPATPIHKIASYGEGSSSPDCPSVTTTIADCMIVRIGGFDDDEISVDNPGLSGHTAITMDESDSGAGTCSGGAGYKQLAGTGSSGISEFTLLNYERCRTVTIAIAPATGGSGEEAVSGGAGYIRQSGSGSSGASTFSLTASQESRTLTIGIAPDPGGGGGGESGEFLP